MKTFIQPGDVLTLIAPVGGVVTGVPKLIGSLLVIPAFSAAADAEFEGMVTGVHELPKTNAQAWTANQKIYWNVATEKADSDGTTGPLIGSATRIEANPTATGRVRLIGAPADALEGPQAAQADLGGALTGATDGALADIAASAAATAGGATPSAAQVDTGIATAVATIVTGTNLQLKELQVAHNALLAKLRIAGIILP